MTPDIVASVRFLLDQIVTGVPGVTGALVSTVDGFAVAERIVQPPSSTGRTPTDGAGLAAMTAAILGVANRMLAAMGEQPANELTASSPNGHVVLCRIGHMAALTVIAGPSARLDDVEVVSREVASGIHRLVTEVRPRADAPPATPPAAAPPGSASTASTASPAAPWHAPAPSAAAPSPTPA